jgi:hypothetical protein
MTKLFAILALTATVLSMLVVGQSPASAHDECVYHGRYEDKTTFDYACVSADHKTLRVCDVEGDTHYVEAWVWWPSGPLPFRDKNGSEFPCSPYELPRGAHRIAVCEEDKGCSEYRKA